MSALRFLQVSDLRFGSVPPLPELEIDGRVRRLLVEDQRRVLERIVALAGEHHADLVLVAGDLIDDAHATPEDADLVMRALASLAPRPVIVAPGELDPPHPASYLSPDVLELMGKTPLPAHVTVFRAPVPATVVVGAVAVTGWAIPLRGSEDPPRGALAIPRATAAHHVLLAQQGKPVYPMLPTPRQLVDAGVRYMALGRDTSTLLMRDEDGVPRLGWAGHPCPHGLSAGAGGVLLGEIDDHGVVRIEVADAGARRVHLLDVDVTGLGAAELSTHLKLVLPERGVRERDLALVRLRGHWPHAKLPAVKKRALEPFCTHVRLDLAGLNMAFRPGATVRDQHRAGLVPAVGDPHAAARLEALRLVDAAWEGGEVSPSGENPSDPV